MAVLREHAQELQRVGRNFADTGQRVHQTWQGLGGVYDAPEVGQLLAATGPVAARSESVSADLGSVGSTLVGYADTVEQIQARLDSLRAQAHDLVAEAQADKATEGLLEQVGEKVGLGGDDDEYAERSNELTGQVNAAMADFYDAQQRCANDINRLYGGKIYQDYGYSEAQLDAAAKQDGALPWGSEAETDTGIVGGLKDASLMLVTDLGALIGRDPVTGEWSFGTAGTAWAGVGKFTLAAAMAANRPGMLVSGDSAAVPGVFEKGEASTLLREAGKTMIAYDEWGKGDNARAGAMAGFNIVSAVVGTKGAGAGLRSVGTGAQASRVGAVSRAGGAMARGGELLHKIPDTGQLAARMSQHLPNMRLPGNVPDINVPHRVDTPNPDIPRADTPNPGTVGDNLNSDTARHTPEADPTPGGHHAALDSLSPDTDGAGQRGADTTPTGTHPDADVPAELRREVDGTTSPPSADRTPDTPTRLDGSPDARPTDATPDAPDADRATVTAPPDRAPDTDQPAAADRTPETDSAPDADARPDADQAPHTIDTDGNDPPGATDDIPHGEERPAGDVTPGDQTLGNQPDGSWVGEEHGQRLQLAPEANRLANDLLTNARRAEPHISSEVASVIHGVDGARPQGFSERLKGEDSLKRKIATDLADDPNLTPAAAIAEIKDSVRYTIEVTPEGYAEGVERAVTDLHARSFENVAWKPTWMDPGSYKGINSTWRDLKTGQLFELQFHTADSFKAKTQTHPLYGAQRLPGVSEAEITRLKQQQAEIFRQVDVPPNVERLHSIEQIHGPSSRASIRDNVVAPHDYSTVSGEPNALEHVDRSDSAANNDLHRDAQQGAIREHGDTTTDLDYQSNVREADWSELATATDSVSERAIHHDSVSAVDARNYIVDQHSYLLDTNADRWASGKPGHDINCTHCVVTVDQQLNGLDVQALPRLDLENSWRDLLDGLPPGRWHNSQTYDNVIRTISHAGPDSRGFVYIARPGDGGAHVFNVLNTPNGVAFLDGQTGTLGLLESNIHTIWLYLYK